MRTHRNFLLLLGLFIIGVLARQAILPVMEGGDEPLHFNYVEWLRAENRLPERANYIANSTVQESGQPPLAYWLYGLPLRLLNIPTQDGLEVLAHLQRVKNRWHNPPDPQNRTDNMNIYYHGPNEQVFGRPDLVLTNRIMRLFSLAFGIAAVVGAYGAAREIFGRESWALTATALFAFMPTMIALTAYVNNDIAVIAFTSLAAWQMLRILRLGGSPARVLLLGALLGMGALCKVSGLLVVPGALAALLIDWRKRGLPLRRLILHGLLLGGVVGAMVVPWMLYGIAVFQDPFGTRTHYDPLFRHEPLLTLGETLRLLPHIYRTYWSSRPAQFDPALNGVFGVIAGLAAVGWGIFAIRRLFMGPHPKPLSIRARSFGSRSWVALAVQQGVVLAVIFAGVFAGLLRWLGEYFFIDGRLLYPAHVPIIMALTGGLSLLARYVPARPLQLGAVGVIAAAGIVAAPARVYATFAPPPRLERLPALQGGVVDYEGIIRFLGQAQAESIIDAHDIQRVTLCWEVLQATQRPAAFSLKFVHDGDIVADRTSVFGMGRFNSVLWQPGDVFCDEVDVPIDDPDIPDDPPPKPGQTYDMLLVLLDAETLDVNWRAFSADGTPIPFPIIGQVTAADSGW